MVRCRAKEWVRSAALSVSLLTSGCVLDNGLWNYVVPEQRDLDIRDIAQLPKAPLPAVPTPDTVSAQKAAEPTKEISLDEAIRVALKHAKVVRVLAGTSAVASGSTIYDPAISNTSIDVAKAAFDPTLSINNRFNRSEQPQGVFDPDVVEGARIDGSVVDTYDFGLGLTKRNLYGGTWSLDVADTHTRIRPGVFPLNPQERSSATLSYTQPLLQGGGIAPNIAPIVIARIQTERSYFQLKDSVQELVRGVVEAYWALHFAKTDVWVRRQQVEQGDAAAQRAEARKRQGFGTQAEVAQTRVALANFKAGLIGAEANLIAREAALRNLLGLPPTEPERLVLTSAPSPTRVEPKWEEIVKLAEERRPDLIELKLILEADQQTIVQARNQALPRLDATLFYRWNGLEGTTPRGAHIETNLGEFTDWSVGVNFSVPLGLRQGRAGLRQAELILARDRANLDQGLHSVVHRLAANVRNLAQFYEQYKVFQEARKAARENLEQQLAEFAANRTIFLNVLQAISDWGNAVSAEAQVLTAYNTELANLERQTGTILETHGVRFTEEKSGFIGPLGRCAAPVGYPAAVVPGPNTDRYPANAEPIEKLLEKDKPGRKG